MKKSDSFYYSVKCSDYTVKKTVKFLFFFNRVVEYFDTSQAEKDASENGCFTFLTYHNYAGLSFHQSGHIEKFRKILILADAEVFYLDDDLMNALSRHIESVK